MNIVKSFSRRSLFWLFILTTIIAAIVNISIYAGAAYIFSLVPLEQLKAAAVDTPALKAGVEEVWPVVEWVRELFFPVSIGLFFLLFLMNWLVARAVCVRALRREGVVEPLPAEPKTSIKKGKKKKVPDGASDKSRFVPDFEADEKPAVSTRETEDRQHRYYLYLLSVLQREGRLLDFLTEDLSPYDDAQIGAAVRSIHENCKKCLEKNISLQSVIEKNEGEPLTVPPDFDSSAIKLTGNVTGDPPFSGTLRHRGWKAGKLDLPVLTGSGDPRVIAPAEVEIM